MTAEQFIAVVLVPWVMARIIGLRWLRRVA
jgi:hypothetical protein